MNPESRIYIAGHRGMVGSALVRRLESDGYHHLILRTRDELDLLHQSAVFDFFQREKPDFVFLAAAHVGGILANDTYRAQFIYENLQIQNNVIHAAYRSDVKKLLFLGSSCIYPKFAPQPIPEDALLSGVLEKTNEPYAIAKIAGIKTCEAYWDQYGCRFFSVMPSNLYGPHDNFDLETSHVLPALIRKFHDAKMRNDPSVTVWGTGKPRREFLHVDDLADACIFLMQQYDRKEFLNIGTGKDIPIAELAELIKQIVGFKGKIVYDHSKPDGTPRKLLDVTRLHSLGWHPRTDLESGLKMTLEWFLKHS
ncbi:NAD-dependent epimerase/dehydratase family protein [candidate division KSB1 bacterium]|nr:NAD-dependent epimerase/dehydratase family protein [candidate division KSB1 bacterium]